MWGIFKKRLKFPDFRGRGTLVLKHKRVWGKIMSSKTRFSQNPRTKLDLTRIDTSSISYPVAIGHEIGRIVVRTLKYPDMSVSICQASIRTQILTLVLLIICE